MNKDICVVGCWTRPIGFKIISKQDAMRFLNELLSPGSHFAFDDLNDPQYRYIVYRRENAGDAPATIAHERKDKLLFEADLMYSGTDAVNMAYAARKSINWKFFRNVNDI